MLTLLNNQTKAQEKLLPYKAAALFMEPGTGKTRVALELVNATDTDLVVWIGPLQTIRTKPGIPSVSDEIGKWGGFSAPVIYCGIESLQSSDRIFLNLHNLIEAASKTFIVVDESLKIKNADAKRTKRLLQLGKMAEYRLVLNGTPITRNLLDLWSQMQFLSPLILNMTLAEFKNTFCEYTKITKHLGGHRSYTKEFITGYENIDYLYSLIRHYVYECDLSLQIGQYYNILSYKVDDESRAEYNRIKDLFLDDETLLWKNNNIFLEMTQKMQHTYCCTPGKFEPLDQLFKTIPEEKTIIFCKYISSQEACRKYFPKATVLSYQKESFGLNLQHLNNTIYFDKIWDYALRLQSGRRTFRTGQEYDCRYWDLTGNVPLENLIDSNISKKLTMTEYFKGKTKEEVRDVL
ncbi:MAG: DEAD/DEAH box helicase [Candidatus Moranbacteria bacterium]|nr:DEAD/DEAH box helicase [Candidatus Moranbacteria bacterium]